MWSVVPSSEVKNKYTMNLLKELGNKYKKPFPWKFSATSRGKGIVDGISGRAKSLVRQTVMNKSSTFEPLIV